jgi:hypothetical protein
LEYWREYKRLFGAPPMRDAELRFGMAVRSVNKQQRYTQLGKKLIEVSPFA